MRNRTPLALTLALACWLGGTESLRADARSAALAVVEQAIQAHGGEDRLARSQLEARKASGTMTMFGKEIPFTVDMILHLPGRYRAIFDLDAPGQKIQTTVGVNQDKGWRAAGGMAADMNKEELEEVQQDAYVMWLMTLVPLRDKDFDLAPVAEANVNGQPALGIKVTRKGQPDVKLYFDKSSHLLTKVEYRAKEGGLQVDKERLLSDYRNVDGARLPGKEVQLTNGKKFVAVTFGAIRFLPRLDDSLFEKP